MPRWFWLPCLLGFIGSLWGSYLFFHSRKTTPSKVTIIFHTYNTKGQEITTARLVGPVPQVSRQDTKGSECQITRPFGSTLDLMFENGSEKRTERVTWLEWKKYVEQSESIIQKQLENLKVPYNATEWKTVLENRIKSRGEVTKYDYPIIFSAK
jgi:hypothetical protein